MTRLSLSLFGPFVATLDGDPISDFATEKARALLAFLAVEPSHPHSRPALTALLWPDQPEERARQNLRQALLHLRQALGENEGRPSFLLATRESVQFNPHTDFTLDVADFVARIAACRSHRHRHPATCRPCLQRLREVVELYHGDFLQYLALPDSETFQEWALLKREWLHQQAIEALAVLANYHEQRGEIALARPYAYRQVELEPWNEEAHQQLMRLLAIEGKRSAALAQYEACRRILDAELAVEPTRATMALYQRIRAGEAVRPAVPPFNLPLAPTSFVGREQELADLAERLAQPECRLLTLLGPGGIGKTRLALQAAAEQHGAYRDGIHFVPLAAVASHEGVLPAIADALHLSFQSREPPAEQLLNYLRSRELLLLLDNLEHLLEGSAFLADILRRAPGVVLLVTSRERLNLREEWIYEVGGLTYPQESGEAGPVGGSAVDLFRQRASQVQQKLDPEVERTHVAQICQLVDGMPLAIELAASWARTHSCAAIAAALTQSLDILATSLRNVPERHRSMRAALQHSWDLLAEQEQTLFRRLAVFRGGFEETAAAQVAAATPAALSALLDKSLLRRSTAGRYEMHELVRQYAGERLAVGALEDTATRDQHAVYYAAFLQDREVALQGKGQKEALEDIQGETDNVRAAWQWATAHAQANVLDRALGALDLFYDMRNWYREGLDAFAAAVAGLPAGAEADLTRWRLRTHQGRFAYRLGKNDQARALLEESLPIFRALGAQRETAFALTLLSWILQDVGDLTEAERSGQQGLAAYGELADCYGMAWAATSLHTTAAIAGRFAASRDYAEQALACYETCGAPRETASALSNLGKLAGIAGDYAGAQAYFERALAILGEIGDRRGTAVCLHNLGTLAYLNRDVTRARQLRQEALAICRQIGYQWGVASSLKGLGDVARQEGEYARAQEYLQAGLAAFQETGDRRSQANCLNSLGQVETVRKRYAEAWHYYQEGLAIAMQVNAAPVVMDILRGIAEVRAGQGDPVQALELVAFVAGQPGSEKQTLEQLEPLGEMLRSQLPPAAAAAAEARGRAKTLPQLSAELFPCR
jgi:predicted ATPase/DNA-binding SARP family transcriptional activator